MPRYCRVLRSALCPPAGFSFFSKCTSLLLSAKLERFYHRKIVVNAASMFLILFYGIKVKSYYLKNSLRPRWSRGRGWCHVQSFVERLMEGEWG